MRPGNFKNHYFEKYLLSMVWNLTVLETSFLSYVSKTLGEILILKSFFGEKINFGLYFTVNGQAIWAQSPVMRSL